MAKNVAQKFQNKYRIPSARLQNWDYAREGAYFITICTQDREHYFGKISKGNKPILCVVLSNIGKIVDEEWMKTPALRPDMNLQLDEYVIMPNHFHAIIAIGKNEYIRTPTKKFGIHNTWIQIGGNHKRPKNTPWVSMAGAVS